MKFSDAVMLAGETSELLKVADTLYGLKNLSEQEISTCSSYILDGHVSEKRKVMSFLVNASFLSLSLIFKDILITDPHSLQNYLANKEDTDDKSPENKIQKEKIKLYYTFRLIASTFDDQNLLKLKKALNDND